MQKMSVVIEERGRWCRKFNEGGAIYCNSKAVIVSLVPI